MNDSEIVAEDQKLLAEIAAAPDWPTTRALMVKRDALWKQHRRWDERAKDWVAK